MSAVRLREVSALERVQLQRDKCNSAGTKFAVRLREVSALESVRLERVDCTLIILSISLFLLPFQGPTRDLYHPSGSFSEPRGHKVPRREDILVDVSSFSSPIGNSSAAPRNATSAVTPRANSGLTELETLVEVETSPRPSPRELKPNELLFDFNEAEQSGGQSGGDELRERSGSSDTLTYEDLPTPTPDSKNARPDEEASSLSSVPGGEGTKTSETDLLTFEANDEDEDADESMGLLISSKSEARTSSDRSGSQDELASCDSQEDLLGSSVESEGWKNENSFQTLGDLRIGQVISVGDKKTGTIRFLGTTEFSPGLWVGVELDVPAGESHCVANNSLLFRCIFESLEIFETRFW